MKIFINSKNEFYKNYNIIIEFQYILYKSSREIFKHHYF